MDSKVDLISELIYSSFAEALQSQQKGGSACSHQKLVVNERSMGDSIVATLIIEGEGLNGFLELFLQDNIGDPRMLFDAAELVNQIAGRFSNQLYQYGFNVRLTPPKISRCLLFEDRQIFDDRLIFLTTCDESKLSLKTVLGPIIQLHGSMEGLKERKKEYVKEGSLMFFDNEDGPET
jgi:hypothetical protein